MSNPLYEQMSKNNLMNQNMMTRFEQFRRTFSGNPQQIVKQMLDSGRISQAQYNHAVNMANQMMKNMK